MARLCPRRERAGNLPMRKAPYGFVKSKEAVQRALAVAYNDSAMKILLIEDDALHEHGHAVDHVADGRAGLERAADERYELLIVDRMLPGVDGLAIVQS